MRTVAKCNHCGVELIRPDGRKLTVADMNAGAVYLCPKCIKILKGGK